MKLSVKERLLLAGILQQKSGNLVTIRLVHELQMALGLSDKEIVDLEITFDGNQTRWNNAKEQPVEIPFGEAALGIIVESLKELDARNALTLDTLPLYEKFCGGPTEEAKSK